MPAGGIASTPSVLRQAQTSGPAEVQQLRRSGMVLAGVGSGVGEILPPPSQGPEKAKGLFETTPCDWTKPHSWLISHR